LAASLRRHLLRKELCEALGVNLPFGLQQEMPVSVSRMRRSSGDSQRTAAREI